MLKLDITIEAKDHHMRIDRWLKNKYKIPYSLIQKLLRKKDITVNRLKSSFDYRLQKGDVITIVSTMLVSKETSSNYSQKEYKDLTKLILNSIIFKDKNIIAINKPYNIPVQCGSKINISIDTILPELCFEYNNSPKLVHRLDRYTTGILLVARTKEISQTLLKMFQDHTISKQYIAILDGIPRKQQGIIKSFIAKDRSMKKEKMVESDTGKEAITKYKILDTSKDQNVSLVAFFPITGRTHQIRVHAAQNLSCPILGDSKYGSRISTNKMHLHSYKITFELDSKLHTITAPLPNHIKETIQNSKLDLQGL